jgi:hypothetical protein
MSPKTVPTLMVAMMMAVLAAAPPAEGQTPMTVCVDHPAMLSMGASMRVAEGTFQQAGVVTKWYTAVRCPADGNPIRIAIEAAVRPTSFHRGALAYASPYEGSHIVIMLDRVQRYASGNATGRWQDVLAYVMAHEIAHILEGMSRHSKSGIMKATFEPGDARDMMTHSLRFDDDDVQLIRYGIQKRGH